LYQNALQVYKHLLFPIKFKIIKSKLQIQLSLIFIRKAWFLITSKGKGLPRQAKVAQGVPGRLRPWIFLTFWHYKGGRSSPATFTPGEIPGIHFRGWVDLRAHGSVGGTMEKNPHWHHRESIPGPFK